MKVQTEAVQFKADQKLIDFIEQKVSRMNHYYDHIINARVRLRLENAGQVKDKVAEIQLKVPGQTLYVRNTDRTFEAAIDGTVDTLKRRLQRFKDRNDGNRR